jgi:hypothetical protein
VLYFKRLQIAKRKLGQQPSNGEFHPSKKATSKPPETNRGWIGRSKFSRGGRWISGDSRGKSIKLFDDVLFLYSLRITKME